MQRRTILRSAAASLPSGPGAADLDGSPAPACRRIAAKGVKRIQAADIVLA